MKLNQKYLTTMGELRNSCTDPYLLRTVSIFKTSTGVYRSCAALASFSGNFDLILFQFIVEKVWFVLVWKDGLDKQTT